MGAYELAQRKAKEEAMRAAQALVAAPPQASPFPDGGPPVSAALTAALSVANAPEVRAEGLGARFVWKVKKVVPEMMVLGTPDLPGLTPDVKGIEAYARGWKDKDHPPIIPGVVFELEGTVSR